MYCWYWDTVIVSMNTSTTCFYSETYIVQLIIMPEQCQCGTIAGSRQVVNIRQAVTGGQYKTGGQYNWDLAIKLLLKSTWTTKLINSITAIYKVGHVSDHSVLPDDHEQKLIVILIDNEGSETTSDCYYWPPNRSIGTNHRPYKKF